MTSVLDISDAVTLGLHAMAYLAWQDAASAGRGAPKRRKARPVSTKEIADAFHISRAHLYKVMESLMDAGLVAVERGRRGGFVLNKPRSQVTLLDVYQAIEGPLIPKNCLLSRRVCKDGRCILGPLINSVNRQVAAQLARTRLCDLVPATANRRKRAP